MTSTTTTGCQAEAMRPAAPGAWTPFAGVSGAGDRDAHVAIPPVADVLLTR